MRILHVKPLWPDSDVWQGRALDANHYAECVRDEAIVLKDDGSGGVLFKVLRNRVPFDVCNRAYPVLCTASQDAANRIEASGRAKPGENGISDVMGFLDGTERYGNIHCRETAWSAEHFLEQHSEVMPLVNTVDAVFHEEMPARWIIQRREMLKAHAAWSLSKVFTTVTINKSMRTRAHRDPGDLKEGFGVITVMKAGTFTGGELIFPRWGIAVDIGTTDVLLCDVHELHGNAPLVGEDGKFLRLTCVYYFRTGILACGSPAEESKRVENREMERIRKRVAARKVGQPPGDRPAVTVDPAPDPSNRIEAKPLPKAMMPPPPRRRLVFTDEHGEPTQPLIQCLQNEHAELRAPDLSVTRQPRVWDCHAGKDYPADAVYVGCRATHPFKGHVIREGTIFGNGAHPLTNHAGGLHSEAEFRAYAIEKLRDPAFRAEAEKLRGKDLLCWCAQEGKRRAEFCHARVWLELINNPQGKLNAELSTEQRLDFDWGYYEPNFLTEAEADALFEMAKAQPRSRPIIKRSGFPLRRCASTCWSVRDRNDDSLAMVPLSDAPPEILSLQRKLSALAGKEVNYFSLQAYENEKDHIGWHQHREDKCRDARVFIISLGECRRFGVDRLCPECRLCDACNQRQCHPDGPKCSNPEKCRAAKKHRKTCAVRKSTKTVRQPGHGSLIALASDANDWYEHAVLDDREPKGLRMSINTKCIPPEDAAAGYVPRELRHAGGFSHEEAQ